MFASCGGSDGGGGGNVGPDDPEPISATLNPGSAQIEIGQTQQFSVTVQFDDGTSRTYTTGGTWSSSDPAVATISSTGVATGLSEGTTTITAAAEGQTRTATLTVVRPAIASIDVTPGESSLAPGQTVQLTATPRSSGGAALTGRTIAWSSSDDAIATVDQNGLVTAVAEGTASITAASEGVQGTANVAIRIPVSSVEIAPATASILVGATQQLTVTIRGPQSQVLTGRAVTWTSSDETVATVDSNGLVSGVASGSVTITATSEGISGTATITVATVPVETVTVTPGAGTIQVSATIQLTAQTFDVNGGTLTGRAVTWTSGNSGVATVDASGLVTGQSAGVAVITATSEGKSATATITVIPIPVATVNVAPGAATVVAGGTQQYTATTLDSNGNGLTGRSVTWTSDNAAVATVNASGLVTAVGVGTTTIRATSEGITGTATITVTPPPVASVDVTPPTASIVVGATQQLTATPKDANGNALTGRAVTWSTSDATVATVDTNGLVTGIAVGTATITATSEGVNGTSVVTVNSVPVATVDLTPAAATVVEGKTTQLTATPRDAGNNALTGRTVTWTTSNAAAATVSTSGLVTGVAPGTATITATVEGKSATSTITVTQAPVNTVEVAPSSASVVEFQTQQLTATTKDADGVVLTGRTVTWTTSNPAVATVSTSGLVTAVAPGTATITATSEGKTGTSTITVTAAPVASVTVAPSTASIVVAATQQLTATLKDGSGNTLTGRTVTWSSDAAGVASVDTNGLVTGVAAGTATITATSSGVTGTATITVTVAPVNSVTVTPSTATKQIAETQQFTAELKDASNNVLTGRTVTWSSSNTGVATIDAGTGLATAVAAGTTTITATSEGVSGTATLTVSSGVAVASVTVSPDALVINMSAGAQTLTATTKDAGNNTLTGRTVTWSSSNTGVATVNSTTGAVTPVSAGDATITATSEGVSGTAKIYVTPSNAAGFQIHLVYVNDVSAQDRAVFDAAAAQWQSAITNDLYNVGGTFDGSGCGHPDIRGGVDDVVIFVTVGPIDGAFNTLAQAGPCYYRNSSGHVDEWSPLTGTMKFDSADMQWLRDNSQLQGTVVHEMGHVIGIGTFWESENLLNGAKATVCLADPRFTGALASAAWQALGGTGNVPVENTGALNDGSNCSHWREATFGNELMSPSLNNGANPLSAMSIQSLADMGYSVNTGAAEAYSLPSGAPPALRVGPVVDLSGDVLLPLFGVARDGTITRTRNPAWPEWMNYRFDQSRDGGN